MAESYDAGTVIIQTYSAGSITIRDYDAGTFVVPQAPVISYPVGALLDYYFPATALTLSDTDPVATWTDVNAAKTLTQGTALDRPIYKASVLSSPAVRFDGVSDYLATSDTDLILNGPVASTSGALLLVLTGAPDATDVPAVWGSTVSISNSLGFRSASAVDIGWVRQTTGTSIAVGASGGTYDPAGKNALLITANSSVFKVWYNGSVVYTSPALAGSWSHDRFSVGGWLRSTFVTPADFDCYACGLAFGAVAAGLHTDPSALFAACTTEWGTP